MSDFRVGDIVDIVIKGVRVAEIDASFGGLAIDSIARDGGPAHYWMPPAAEITRVAPAEGPPRPDDHLTPEHEADIRKRVAYLDNNVSLHPDAAALVETDVPALLAEVERLRAELTEEKATARQLRMALDLQSTNTLAEVDRLRALDRNSAKNETENEKFLVAACAVIDSVLDTDGNDGLLADIQRLADEVKGLRALLDDVEELVNEARRPFGITRSEAFDAICRLMDGGAQ